MRDVLNQFTFNVSLASRGSHGWYAVWLHASRIGDSYVMSKLACPLDSSMVDIIYVP